MSIVDQIVTSHDGELKIDSEAGKGTVVTIVLPILAQSIEAGNDKSSGVRLTENLTDDADNAVVTELLARSRSEAEPYILGESVTETEHKQATA